VAGDGYAIQTFGAWRIFFLLSPGHRCACVISESALDRNLRERRGSYELHFKGLELKGGQPRLHERVPPHLLEASAAIDEWHSISTAVVSRSVRPVFARAALGISRCQYGVSATTYHFGVRAWGNVHPTRCATSWPAIVRETKGDPGEPDCSATKKDGAEHYEPPQ